MSKTSVWRHFDLWLAAAIVLLTAFGILIQKSAVTGAPDLEPLPNRQILWAIAGITAMLIISAIDYRILTAGHWYIYLGLVASLLLVVLIGQINNEARRWFDKEFADLECEPSNPMGKVLIIDKILNVARYGGEQRFIDRQDWATRFARYTALALGRDTVRIDVAAFNIGY